MEIKDILVLICILIVPYWCIKYAIVYYWCTNSILLVYYWCTISILSVYY